MEREGEKVELTGAFTCPTHSRKRQTPLNKMKVSGPATLTPVTQNSVLVGSDGDDGTVHHGSV